MKQPPRPKPQPHIKPDVETFDQILTRVTANMKERQKDGKQFFTGQTIKQRHKALRNTEALINARHDLASLSENFVTTSEMWVMENLCVFGNTDFIEKERRLSLGAAIWMLDHAEGAVNIPFQYVDLPDLYDPAHDDDLIRATVHLIKSRSNPDYADAYAQLLSQIPEEAKKTALTHFEDAFWEWVDHVFDFIKPAVSKIGSLIRQYNHLVDEYNENLNNVDKLIPEEKKFNPLLANPFQNVLQPATNSTLSSFSGPRSAFNPLLATADDALSRLHKMTAMVDQMENIKKEIDRIQNQLFTAIVIPIDLSLIHTQIYEETNPKLLPPEEDFPTFVPGDPYELCFAFFQLQDADSDLSWLWGACMGLMNQVGKNLPWGLSDYGDYKVPKAKKPVKLPDQHLMQYYTKGQDYPVSLAQLVYNLGGGILPRDMSVYTGWSEYLRKVGVKDVRLGVAMIAIFQAIRRRDSLSTVKDPDEPEYTSEDVAELQESIKTLRGKLKLVTDEAHAHERRAQRAEQALAEEKEKSKADRAELADLREVLFTEEQEEDTGVTLPLPYTVKSRLVVYGGHDTWLKAMKGYVNGDIRFIDKDQGILDRSVIRNANAVWIQHNAISHKQYYAIIDEVRKWDKPVHYFMYASAKKCVEQIAKEEE